MTREEYVICDNRSRSLVDLSGMYEASLRVPVDMGLIGMDGNQIQR